MDVGMEFHSLSKSYNMTGWRIGMAVGNAEMINALMRVKSNLDSGIPQAIQRAGSAEPAKIRAALEKTDYLAPNGRIRFDSKHQAYGLELVLVEIQNKVPVVQASGVIKSPND